MKLKYWPVKWPKHGPTRYPDANPDTVYEKVDDNSLTRDGILLEFPAEGVTWDSEQLRTQTQGFIMGAERVEGELHITAKLFYTGVKPRIADGEYHELEGQGDN